MRQKTKQYPIIKLDPLARGFVFVGAILGILLFVAALDSVSIYLALAALGWEAMILIGFLFGRIGLTEKRASDRGRKFDILIFALVAIATFVLLDTWAPAFLPRGVSLSSLSSSNAATLAILAGTLAAIAEETFFRYGVANQFSKLVGKFGSIILSGLFFGVMHVFAYPVLAVIVIIWIAGMILAYIDFRTGLLSVSMVAHIGNNLLQVLYSTIVLQNLNLISPQAIQAGLRILGV